MLGSDQLLVYSISKALARVVSLRKLSLLIFYGTPAVAYLKVPDNGIELLVLLGAFCECLHGFLKARGVVRVELQEWS